MMHHSAVSSAHRPAPNQPADMSVLVTRVDLYDSGSSMEDHPASTHGPNHGGNRALPAALDYPRPPIAPAFYDPDHADASQCSVAICRVPDTPAIPLHPLWMQIPVVDNTTPCPHTHDPTLVKYWNQRRRLFSKFDMGCQLDDEGWFSVTPEQIADYVAYQLRTLFVSQPAGMYFPITILDLFCGCGGNAIAFAKLHNVSVIGIDVDRSKLRRAAHNAAIYGIPPSKLILVECNALFILEHCYRRGAFVLDEPLTSEDAAKVLMEAMPPPVPTEVTTEGYSIGGIDLLPRQIHAIFMDPPWGGVDYEVFGKHGYDLVRNMRIARPSSDDTFFDCFQQDYTGNKEQRKAYFNCTVDETNSVNGLELLRLAAQATAGCVAYDVPRNTNRQSLALSALAAGYRGNCKWEEHYLNGRLKTVTCYFGHDWSHLLHQGPPATLPPFHTPPNVCDGVGPMPPPAPSDMMTMESKRVPTPGPPITMDGVVHAAPSDPVSSSTIPSTSGWVSSPPMTPISNPLQALFQFDTMAIGQPHDPIPSIDRNHHQTSNNTKEESD